MPEDLCVDLGAYDGDEMYLEVDMNGFSALDDGDTRAVVQLVVSAPTWPPWWGCGCIRCQLSTDPTDGTTPLGDKNIYKNGDKKPGRT